MALLTSSGQYIKIKEFTCHSITVWIFESQAEREATKLSDGTNDYSKFPNESFLAVYPDPNFIVDEDKTLFDNSLTACYQALKVAKTTISTLSEEDMFPGSVDVLENE